MAATLHKLTAGDGYLYLIRQVAASDSTERGRNTLSEYYSAKGESPGYWVGTGLASLSSTGAREVSERALQEIWAVPEGSEVYEQQMAALFGEGLHPNAVDITTYTLGRGAQPAVAIEAAHLGRRFAVRTGETEFQRALAVAYREHNTRLGQKWNTPSTMMSGHRSEPPWHGSDSPTNTVASPPTTVNCRASSPATPAPAPQRSPDTT